MKTPEEIREAVELMLWAMLNTPSTPSAQLNAIGTVSALVWASGGVSGAPDFAGGLDEALADIRRIKARHEAYRRN